MSGGKGHGGVPHRQGVASVMGWAVSKQWEVGTKLNLALSVPVPSLTNEDQQREESMEGNPT